MVVLLLWGTHLAQVELELQEKLLHYSKNKTKDTPFQQCVLVVDKDVMDANVLFDKVGEMIDG